MSRMPRFNTLIARTGLQRGWVLNGTGQNLTDTSGAGNGMVGTYCLDFSGMFRQNEVPLMDADNVGHPNADQVTSSQNDTLIDNEYTIVIADARFTGDQSPGNDNDLEDDEYPERDDGTVVRPDTDGVTVDQVTVEMQFRCPMYNDASVWVTDPMTGDLDTIAEEGETLAMWLDAWDRWGTAGVFDTVEELTDDFNPWHLYWTHLRWTLHWALLVIQTQPPRDQGLIDYVSANSNIPTATNAHPVAGPFGLLAKLGGDTSQAVRLWMPLEDSGGARVVARGQAEYPYALLDSAYMDADPNQDTDFDGDLMEGAEAVVTESSPSTAATRGRNIRLRCNIRRQVRLRPGELLVWMVHTGRARLTQGDRTAAEGAGDLIIAGPELVGGRNGPLITPYYWYARATGTRRE